MERYPKHPIPIYRRRFSLGRVANHEMGAIAVS